jgi:multiple sugar transport system ATP-binding protein
MTVYRNIAFGLKMRGFPRNQIAERVREALRFVELEGYEDRRPAELSGGQRQRVAVARMVAGRPDFLLFDEPLSNLDPKLRGSVRTELKRLHERMGATSIYVTHDQTEAFVLANRIAVMQDGEIVQIDDADGIYHFPKTAAVADFTGNPGTNLIPGQVHSAAAETILIPEVDPYCFVPLPRGCRPYSGRRMIVHARAEDVEITGSPGEDQGTLTVMAVMNEGPDVLVHLCFEDRRTQVIARSRRGETAALEPEAAVGLRFRRGNLYDADTGRLVDSFGHER